MIVAALLAAGGIDGPVDFVVVGLALYDLIAMAMTVVHETAHAVAALVLGLGVREVSLGVGPKLGHWMFGATRIVLRLLPVGGHTMILPRGPSLRSRMILVTAAGPLSHIPLAAWLWTLHTGNLLWDALLSPVPELILLHMAFNLIPLLENDGRNLWRLMTWPEERITSVAAMGEAMGELMTTIDDPVANPVTPRQREAILGSLETVRDPADRALSLNNLAYFDLLGEDPSLLEEADAASQEALELLPDVAAVRNTRGAVMIMLGRYEEGIELMRPTMSHLAAHDLSESHLSLALAHARAGRVFEARQHLHAVTSPVARTRLLAETRALIGGLEAPVLRAFLLEAGDPAEAAARFRRELGPASRTTGEALRAHIEATGEDIDLAPVAAALAPAR